MRRRGPARLPAVFVSAQGALASPTQPWNVRGRPGKLRNTARGRHAARRRIRRRSSAAGICYSPRHAALRGGSFLGLGTGLIPRNWPPAGNIESETGRRLPISQASRWRSAVDDWKPLLSQPDHCGGGKSGSTKHPTATPTKCGIRMGNVSAVSVHPANATVTANSSTNHGG